MKRCANCDRKLVVPGTDYCGACAGVPLMLRRFLAEKEQLYRFKFYDSLGDLSQFVSVRATSYGVAVGMAKRETDLPYYRFIGKESVNG